MKVKETARKSSFRARKQAEDEKTNRQEAGRIQSFRDSIRNGRKYPCLCCHRVCFQNGVTEYSNDFHTHVTEKFDFNFS